MGRQAITVLATKIFIIYSKLIQTVIHIVLTMSHLYRHIFNMSYTVHNNISLVSISPVTVAHIKSGKPHRMYVVRKPINNPHLGAFLYILVKGNFTSACYLKAVEIIRLLSLIHVHFEIHAKYKFIEAYF